MDAQQVGKARIGRRTVLVGAALGVGALVAGCSSSEAPSRPASAGGGGQPNGTGIPKADELRAEFESTAKELLVPGAVMLLRAPEGDLRQLYGTRTFGGSDPVTFGDHTRIGSITKTFTGTAILQMAQEGKLDINAPVSDHRPDVPNGREITLTQLLNMRSGLYNYSEDLKFNETLDADPARVWTTDELLAITYRNEPYFPPGTGWHYSNANTVLLGLIAEQIDNQPLGTIYRNRLFTPLGMRETSLAEANTAAIPTPHTRGYMYGTNVGTVTSAELPEDMQLEAVTGALNPTDKTDASPSWTWAAGGAISTIDDLATWARALGDGSLLNPEWQRRRLDSVQPVNPGAAASVGYGLALAKFGPMYGHTGELPGFQAFTGTDPGKKTTLSVWVNLNSSPDGQAPASTIAQRLIGTMYS